LCALLRKDFWEDRHGVRPTIVQPFEGGLKLSTGSIINWHIARLKLENDELDVPTYRDLKFTDIVYRIEDGPLGIYVYWQEPGLPQLVEAGDEDTFYRINTSKL
jgi:hypothetical protein